MSDVNEAATSTETTEQAAVVGEAATAPVEGTAEGATAPASSTEMTPSTAAPAATDAKNVGNRVRHELEGKIFFPGKEPATEGTTYGIMQAILGGHPDGLTADQFTKATIEKSGDIFKKSTAFQANRERHVRGYLVGGIKRGYFTTKADEAAAELHQKKRAAAGEKGEKAPKGEVKPRTSKNILELLETVKSETGEGERALVVKVAEKMKKTLKNLAKGIASGVEQGLIVEHKSESGELVAIALTDKGRETLTPAPTAPAGDAPAADAATTTEGGEPSGESASSSEPVTAVGSDTPF
jgi:hypothetical protein